MVNNSATFVISSNIALPDAACDDTGQAFVAVGQVDHQNLILTQIGLFDKADSLGGSLCCQVFPAVIQGFQIPGQLFRLGLRGRAQQLQCPLCSVQAATGVDAGADDEADVVGGELLTLQAVDS